MLAQNPGSHPTDRSRPKVPSGLPISSGGVYCATDEREMSTSLIPKIFMKNVDTAWVTVTLS
jgi:hypothetical protein